jgi:hypothetical protein
VLAQKHGYQHQTGIQVIDNENFNATQQQLLMQKKRQVPISSSSPSPSPPSFPGIIVTSDSYIIELEPVVPTYVLVLADVQFDGSMTILDQQNVVVTRFNVNASNDPFVGNFFFIPFSMHSNNNVSINYIISNGTVYHYIPFQHQLPRADDIWTAHFDSSVQLTLDKAPSHCVYRCGYNYFAWPYDYHFIDSQLNVTSFSSSMICPKPEDSIVSLFELVEIVTVFGEPFGFYPFKPVRLLSLPVLLYAPVTIYNITAVSSSSSSFHSNDAVVVQGTLGDSDVVNGSISLICQFSATFNNSDYFWETSHVTLVSDTFQQFDLSSLDFSSVPSNTSILVTVAEQFQYQNKVIRFSASLVQSFILTYINNY